MDFPKANFPNNQTAQTTRREVFYEYGSHGYIDVGSTNCGQGNEVFCQKVPEGYQRKRDSLCAKRPTLPLSSRPKNVYKNKREDHIMSKVLKVQEEALNFKKLVNLYNFKNRTLSERVKRQIRTYHSSSSRNREQELHNDMLQKLAEQYQKFRDLSDIPKTNSEYAGGCVSCLPGSRSSDRKVDVRLVSATGNNLSQLRITEIKINHKDLTLRPTRHEVVEDIPLREVTTRCVSGVEHIAVRGVTTCRLYSNGYDSSTFTSVGKAQFTTEQGHTTSVCLSGYVPGDCLVSTTTGAVHLWSPGHRPKQVIEDRSTRFTCTLPWRRAEFGAHPREVIASDPTVVQLFDIRQSPKKPGVDLFALPSPSVLSGERIHISTQSTASEFYHFVACDYSFFLLDQRFPTTPVLSWKHMLVNPPQYLEGVNFPTKGHSLLLMASQSPPEVCCYRYKCSSGMAAQALGAPWRVSRIDDVFHHGSVCGGTAEMVLTKRFNTSLTGVAAVPIDDGFFAVQVDSYGEVFYQGYSFTNEERDKTCSMEIDSQSWDDFTTRKGRKWISGYVKSLGKNKDKHCKQILTLQQDYYCTGITLAKQPHINCPLCHPDMERIDTDTDQCPACHQSLTTGQQLVQAGKGLVKYWPDDIQHLGEQSKSPGHLTTWNSRNSIEIPPSQISRTEEEKSFPQTNALSKILVALWEEESPDLTALLLDRDEEVNKKKKASKETRTKKSNTLEDEDQRLIRSLQQAVDGRSQQGLPPGGAMSENLPSWTDNREIGSDGEDSDASFHKLFGIDTSTLREDDHPLEDGDDSMCVTPGGGLESIAERSQEFLKSTNFSNVRSPKKKKQRFSLFPDNTSDTGVRQPTDDLEAFSVNESNRVTQTTDGDENMDDWDSLYFSQDIAQSFTMFSGSLAVPSKATPAPSATQLTSFTSKLQQLGVTDSPKTDWKTPKKKSKILAEGF